jgi:hypothetical protein
MIFHYCSSFRKVLNEMKSGPLGVTAGASRDGQLQRGRETVLK